VVAPDEDTLASQDDQERLTLGRELRKAREDAGLTQADVEAPIGIRRTSVSAIENGKRGVSSLELNRFAQLYKRSIISFLGGETHVTGMETGQRQVPVRGRNTTFPTLADGTDLTQWANQRVAQSELPRIMRQLILATVPRVGQIGFPADEGIQQGGWDGIVEVPDGNAYVPDGVSVWELGVNTQVKSKADADYAKRTGDPGDIDTKSTTFVFVTPRRWGGKDEWVAEKRKEGVWKDVRAYDGDALATWLELARGVHLRLSLLMGKIVDGAEDLLRWWDVWSAATRPVLTANLVIAGRKPEADRIRDWLREPPSLISIRGENRDGAIAFLAASLHQIDAEVAGSYSARSVVVEQSAAWRSLLTSESPLVLVPTFEDRMVVAAAVAAGHHVIVPLGNGDASSGNTIEIPRPHRGVIKESLLAMGIPEATADYLATLGRRSFAALRRRLATDPAILSPRWAQANEARTLLSALLVGRWEDRNSGDREVIARLAGEDYISVSATLMRWVNESDPPVRLVGGTWMLASREEAWQLLSRFVTRDDLERFADVAAEVLGQVDPRYDLPVRERAFAGIRGKVLAQSGHLREGLAETLAVMATYSDSSTLANVDSGQQWSDRIVRQLLADERGWRVWASLAWHLPLLAEASPSVFLDAVDQALVGEQPVLRDLFTDHASDFGTFDNSPHTGLLWALEVLSWSPDHLGEAALCLASLARTDPGGKLGNRPIGSLREIFLSWHSQTAASAAQRLRVLDQIRRREPGPAWQLMIRLLPEMDSVGQFTSKPRWRDWASGLPEEVAWGEIQRAAAEILSRLLEDVGADGHRWSDLIEHLDDLPAQEFAAVARRLNEIDPGGLSANDRKLVWDSLRVVISKHIAFADAKWAMTKEQLSELQQVYRRFEDDDPIGKTVSLFSDNPDIIAPRADNWQEHEKRISDAQVEAVRAVHSAGGSAALLDLAAQSERPAYVGRAIGLSDVLGEDDDFFLWQNLGSSTDLRRSMALGHLAARASEGGEEWLERQASSRFAAYAAPQQLADFYCQWPFIGRTWDRVDALDEETRRLYWGQVGIWGLGDAISVDHERAVANFVRVGRFDAAIKFISLYSREDKPRVRLATVADVLRKATQEGGSVNWSDLGYDIAKLLTFLDDWENKDEAQLAGIEWSLLLLLRHYGRPPRTLYRALATQPEFFCEVLKLVYRAKGEEPTELTAEEETRSRLAYELLQGWHVLPGLQLDGGVDHAALMAWIVCARDLASKSGRGTTGDQQIGRMLSSSPKGSDEAWPHEAVREVIDELNNRDINAGVSLGVYNSRGATVRGLSEGGAQERTLVEKYRGYARSVRDQWPRTARLLEQIADSFDCDARREDIEAELTEDLWR